jgi:hypothetical protein
MARLVRARRRRGKGRPAPAHRPRQRSRSTIGASGKPPPKTALRAICVLAPRPRRTAKQEGSRERTWAARLPQARRHADCWGPRKALRRLLPVPGLMLRGPFNGLERPLATGHGQRQETKPALIRFASSPSQCPLPCGRQAAASSCPAPIAAKLRQAVFLRFQGGRTASTRAARRCPPIMASAAQAMSTTAVFMTSSSTEARRPKPIESLPAPASSKRSPHGA